MAWRKNVVSLGFALGFGLAGARAAYAADTVADFYHNKTVRLIVGAGAGGGYDLAARTIASRLNEHLPGNPKVVVDNMPAASGLVMANYLYSSAAKDGTYIGMPVGALALEPSLKILSHNGGNVSFDVSKFNWLGSAAQQPQVLFVWHTSTVQTAEDLKRTKTVMGSVGVGSDGYILPTILNNMLGAKMEIVSGYVGNPDMFAAIERGELQGHSAGLANLTSAKPDWIPNHLVRVLVQFGRERLPALKDVPTAIELASDQLDKDALRFYSYKFDIAYTLITPPGIPPERLQALETGFDETMRDPEYQSRAQQISLPLNPLNSAEVTKVIEAINATPQPVIANLERLMTAKPAN